MKTFRNVCLSLMLLTAPLSVAFGDGVDKAGPPAVKAGVSREGARAARIQKDKEKVRKIVLAKKLQRQSGHKTVKKAVKKKVASKSKLAPRKLQHSARRSGGATPARLGIRTWAFPETSTERTSKIKELKSRITETENAYDAENAKYQKLIKQGKEQANPAAGKTGSSDGTVVSSQRRLGEIMQQLDALHQHRNAVSDIVFLKTVRD